MQPNEKQQVNSKPSKHILDLTFAVIIGLVFEFLTIVYPILGGISDAPDYKSMYHQGLIATVVGPVVGLFLTYRLSKFWSKNKKQANIACVILIVLSIPLIIISVLGLLDAREQYISEQHVQQGTNYLP